MRSVAASDDADGGAALPFGVLVCVIFFAAEALERGVMLAQSLSQMWGRFGLTVLLEQELSLLLAVMFAALLALMIALRTRAGRLWGVIYLAAVTGVGLALLVIEPARWVELGTWGRLREVATYAINLLLVAVLAGRKAREALIR